jgi:hypothetical protein
MICCLSLIKGMSILNDAFIHQWLYSPLLDRGLFFSFTVLCTVGRTPWTGHQPVTKPLRTRRTTQTRSKPTHTHTQTSMPRAGFGPTTLAFERRRQFMTQTMRPICDKRSPASWERCTLYGLSISYARST